MADFQYSLDALKAEAIDLYAASVDPLDKAVETVKKLNLRFPVAYGLEAEKISETFGAFYEEEKKFLQPTNFLIGPDNKILRATYSTGSIGRFTALDVINMVKFLKSDQKKSFHLKDGKLEVQ